MTKQALMQHGRTPHAVIGTLILLLLVACTPGTATPTPPSSAACTPRTANIAAGSGQVFASTRWTNKASISTGTTGTGSVDVQCKLTMDSSGWIESDCTFWNNDNTNKHFLFCDMIDVQHSHPGHLSTTPSNAPACDLNQVGSVLQCSDGVSAGAASSVHFGCREVNLGPNASQTVNFANNTIQYIPPTSASVGAWNFMVNYADIWNMAPGGLTYDSASCKGIEGQAGWVLPQLTPNSAYWVVYHLPFDDPYLGYDIIQSGESTVEVRASYATFADMPCLPPEFYEALPESQTALPACPGYDTPPPPIAVDLNLFWWESHMGEEGTEFPVNLRLTAEGEIDGIRMEVTINEDVYAAAPGEDIPITIPGGEEMFGTLRLCAAGVEDECLSPEVAEGHDVTITAEYYSADEEGRFLFSQSNRFTKDTQPPIVDPASFHVEYDGANLVAELLAFDQTTAPVHATLWYTTNGGESWEQAVMELDREALLAGAQENRFALTLTPEELGDFDPESFRHFVAVQDSVFNLIFVTAPEGRLP